MMLSTFERFAIWAALALSLASADITFTAWQFWAITVLVLIIQWSALNTGREDGAITTLQLPVDEFTRLQRELFEDLEQ